MTWRFGILFYRTYLIILIPILWLSGLSIHAAISDTNTSENIQPFSVNYFYDPSRSKTINEISQTTFSQSIPKQFALGYRSGTAWFKLTLNNQSNNEEFILHFTEPFWTNFDLYEKPAEKWKVSKNGLNTPLAKREIQDSLPTFYIHIKQGHSKTLYVKGTTVSSHIGEFQFFTQKEYYKPGRISIAKVYNIYSGVLAFILLLIGFLYFVVREKIYLYYIAYVLSFIIWINIQNGHYLYLGIPGWIHALHAIGALVVFYLINFTEELLDLKNNSPKIGKVFQFSAIVVLLCSALISFNIPHINLFFNIYSSLFFLLLLYTSIRAWINNYFISARYYLIALCIYMPTMALMTLTYNGFLPNIDLTRYAFVVGSIIEIIFFSFILVSYYNDTVQRKMQIQQELLVEREQQADKLELEVEIRTSELNLINHQLRQQTTELEKTKKRLTIEATTDSLSSLYNRRYFFQLAPSLFEQAITDKTIMSLLMIDIDRFKGINDNFGHSTGDEAIKACVKVFLKLVNNNHLIARYGGEEFVILMPNSNKEDSLKLAEIIRNNVEKLELLVKDKKVNLTISIGVTEIHHNEDSSIENIIKRADAALYMAKNNGRNNVLHI